MKTNVVDPDQHTTTSVLIRVNKVRTIVTYFSILRSNNFMKTNVVDPDQHTTTSILIRVNKVRTIVTYSSIL